MMADKPLIFTDPRLRREARTIEAMMAIYCEQVHHSQKGELCESCTELQTYASSRLMRCPYQGDKPTCANCPIHCYQPDKREQVRVMMRYAGPRMLLRHPWLAVLHLLDGRKKAPPLGRKTG
jgi:hypothetical protein